MVDTAGEIAEAKRSEEGFSRLLVVRKLPTSTTTATAVPAINAARPFSRTPSRTGFSSMRNMMTAQGNVTARRNPKSGHCDSPVRAGVNHKKIGQCSRYTP